MDLVIGMSENIKQECNNYHVTSVRGEKIKDNSSIFLFKDHIYIFDTEKFEKKQKKDRPLISFKSANSLQDLINHWLLYHQKEINALQKISVDQIETCKQFMKQGLGMAILPKSVSHNLMANYPHLP